MLAVVNYLYQLRKIQKDLMMTKQEVKEENATPKAIPRSAWPGAGWRAASCSGRCSGVPTADVVVTNPTHFAVR